MRIEPPVSDPSAPCTSRAATAAPEPPLDPPGTRVRSQGLRVGGVTLPQANSCVRVLPISDRARRAQPRHGGRVSQRKRQPGARLPAVVGMSA